MNSVEKNNIKKPALSKKGWEVSKSVSLHFSITFRSLKV